MPGTVLAAGEMVEPGRGCWDCQGGSGKEEPQREGCIRDALERGKLWKTEV